MKKVKFFNKKSKLSRVPKVPDRKDSLENLITCLHQRTIKEKVPVVPLRTTSLGANNGD